MALRLPGAEDLGPAPSGRSGRPIATYDTSAIGRGLANFGAGAFQLAGDLSKIEAHKQKQADQATAFDTQRRYLEFQASQRDALNDMGNSAEPGAFGFKEKFQDEYLKRAKAFYATVPDQLKPEYDSKLFQTEDSLTQDAHTFELKQRSTYYTNATNDGLTKIENALYADPSKFDAHLKDGDDFINALPDADVSPIQKEALRRAWKQKAQLAALNGLPAQERLKALGVGSVGPMPKDVSDRAATAVQHFVSLGWSPVAAAGIVGNLVGESQLNPGAVGDQGMAHGVAQWRGERLTELQRFAASRGKDWHDFGTQLDFVDSELRNSEATSGNRLKAATTVEEATAAGIGYERPKGYSDANPSAGDGWNRRLAAAQRVAGVPVTAKGDVDPRFADLSYTVQDKAITEANTEISRQETEQKASDSARNKLVQGQLALGIKLGTVTKQDILGSQLPDSDKATLLGAYETEFKERGQAQALNNMILSGGGASINPFNSKETAVADKAYDMALAAVPPDRQGDVGMAWVQQSRYIPKTVQATVRAGAASPDPMQLGNAMVLADRLQRSAPVSFSAMDGSKDVSDKLTMFRSFVNDRGMSEEEAAKRVIELNDPAKKPARAVLKPEAEKFVKKDLTLAQVTDAFDPGLFASEPGAGLMPSQQNALLAEYRDLAEERFYETGGDKAAAKALALNDLKQTWGVTTMSGSPQLMRQWPEKFYPQIGGSFEFLRNDALKTAKDYVTGAYPDRTVENIAVVPEPDGSTRRDIEAGRPPRYQLWYSYKDKATGQTLFDQVFAGPWGIGKSDLEKMMDKDSGDRHAQFQAKRTVESAAADAETQGKADAARAAQEPGAQPLTKAIDAETAYQRGQFEANKIRFGGGVKPASAAKPQTSEDKPLRNLGTRLYDGSQMGPRR